MPFDKYALGVKLLKRWASIENQSEGKIPPDIDTDPMICDWVCRLWKGHRIWLIKEKQRAVVTERFKQTRDDGMGELGIARIIPHEKNYYWRNWENRGPKEAWLMTTHGNGWDGEPLILPAKLMGIEGDDKKIVGRATRKGIYMRCDHGREYQFINGRLIPKVQKLQKKHKPKDKWDML